MEDIFKSIKAYLYDRAASPLIGAFIVAWSVWNYRIGIIVFGGGDRPVEEIFSQIDNLYATHQITAFGISLPVNGVFFHGAFVPTILTLIYIYVYPWISKPVYEHSLRKQKELREIKQESENNRLLSVEESRGIYRRLAELQAKHEEEIDTYEKQVASLNETIKQLEAELSSEVNQADKLRESPFDDINDADPEEFDKSIEQRLKSTPAGEFQLSDLFNEEQWMSLNSSLKQSIGKRFKSKVQHGDFVGIKVERKGSGNQQIYSKEISNK